MARVSEKVGGIPETLTPGVDSRRAEEGWPAFQVVRDADIQIQAAEKGEDNFRICRFVMDILRG